MQTQPVLAQVKALHPMDNPLGKLPFVDATLRALSAEISGSGATLLGFIGTPWTLAAYAVEGKAERNCRRTKSMMFNNPEVGRRSKQVSGAGLASPWPPYTCSPFSVP